MSPEGTPVLRTQMEEGHKAVTRASPSFSLASCTSRDGQQLASIQQNVQRKSFLNTAIDTKRMLVTRIIAILQQEPIVAFYDKTQSTLAQAIAFCHRLALSPYFKKKTTYRSIKCTPLAVSTTPLTSPGLSAKAASSNSFCIWPFPNIPRSPLFLALLQSLSLIARSPRLF